MDGISRPIDETDAAFNHSKQHFTPLAAALIDLKKSFDSICFVAVYSDLQRLGVPPKFINSFIRMH